MEKVNAVNLSLMEGGKLNSILAASLASDLSV